MNRGMNGFMGNRSNLNSERRVRSITLRMNISPDGSEEVLRMLRSHVPALASGALEVKAMARERGRRCVFFVHSPDPAVDSVGAFVGNRGEHLKAVVQALNPEHIDVVRWTASIQQLITNALAPVAVREVVLDQSSCRAMVTIDETRSWPRSGSGSTETPIQGSRVGTASGWNCMILPSDWCA